MKNGEWRVESYFNEELGIRSEELKVKTIPHSSLLIPNSLPCFLLLIGLCVIMPAFADQPLPVAVPHAQTQDLRLQPQPLPATPMPQASKTPQAPPQQTTTYTNLVNCVQSYKIDPEKLFYLTLASINANKYNVVEIQTRGGFILFDAGGKQFMTTVAKVDSANSIVKVSPADNSYYFPPAIVNNLFYYITSNTETPLCTVFKGK